MTSHARCKKSGFWITRMPTSMLLLLLTLTCDVVLRGVDADLVASISDEPDVRWFSRQVQELGLWDLFRQHNVTVFLPSNAAFFSFDASSLGYNRSTPEVWRNIILYSSVPGMLHSEEIYDNMKRSSRYNNALLFFNARMEDSKQVKFVNGARLLKADVTTDTGVLHIVDRVIAPFASNKTLADYINSPDIPNYSFRSILMAKIVVPELENRTARRDLFFTSFSPNDSFINAMPEFGKDILFNNLELLRDVYRAHVVPDKVVFLPEEGDVTPVQATAGQVSFHRVNGQLYVYNNRVQARIIQPNLPVANGVLHVIDNLLYYVYTSVRQMIDLRPETRKMAELLHGLGTEAAILGQTDSTFTLFVPTDVAFAKIPPNKQLEFSPLEPDGLRLLRSLVFGHVIPGVDLRSEDLLRDQDLRTHDNRTITVMHRNGRTYVEAGGVRAEVEVMDLGCTNGVVHLVSSVLFFRNFTIWEALENIPDLSIMHGFAVALPAVEERLMSERYGPMTVFFARNSVLESLSTQVRQSLQDFPAVVHEAIRGQIAQGQFSSSTVDTSLFVGTLSGKRLNLFKAKDSYGGEAFMVEGSHVTGRVVVSDVWCSNGILHIVDDVIHVPLRHIFQEMNRRNYLGFTYNIFEALGDVKTQLSSLERNFTVFVPHNEAYAKLPYSKIDALLTQVKQTRSVMSAHIVSGVSKYLDSLHDRDVLNADMSAIHIVKRNGEVYVVNNNIWAKIIIPDIPASNGWIHVIDTILFLPSKTVAETLFDTPETRMFRDLMERVPDFNALLEAESRNLTLFIPSSTFLSSMETEKLARIRDSPSILYRLFRGHVLPKVRLDDLFLRQYPDADYVSLSSLNTTFSLRRVETGAFIDAGFDAQYVDLIGHGYGCTNGVVYVIDGFLNYSPFTVLERLLRLPDAGDSVGKLIELATNNATDELDREDTAFTLVVPSDTAMQHLSFSEIDELRALPLSERLQVFWRHVINGSEVTYDDLRHGNVKGSQLSVGVTLLTSTKGVFFKWRDVESKVIQSNLVASNGVLHLVNRFLYAGETTTTVATTTSGHVFTPTEQKQPMKDETPKADPSSVDGSKSFRPEKVVLVLSVAMSTCVFAVFHFF